MIGEIVNKTRLSRHRLNPLPQALRLSSVKAHRTFLLATTSAGVVLACVGDLTHKEGAPAEWELSETPVASIGVVEGDPMYQLFRANSAVRLDDGRIVVANTGTGELRFFDPAGRFLFKAGRRGGGPGEFRLLWRVYRHGSDSLLAYDQAGGRITVFDANGDFVRTTRLEPSAGSEFPWDVWLYRRNWVEGVRDPAERTMIARVLDRMPSPEGEPGYRLFHIDPVGNLWMREHRRGDDLRRRWAVFDTTGSVIASALMPAWFEVYQLGLDFVLGRWRDESDVEHVRVYALERSTAPSKRSSLPETPVPTVASDDEGSLVETTKAALRSVLIAQERYFAGHGSYATVGDDLEWEGPDDVTMDIVAAEERGWVAVAVHSRASTICAMGIGSVTPAGWSEGVPKCSAARYPTAPSGER